MQSLASRAQHSGSNKLLGIICYGRPPEPLLKEFKSALKARMMISELGGMSPLKDCSLLCFGRHFSSVLGAFTNFILDYPQLNRMKRSVGIWVLRCNVWSSHPASGSQLPWTLVCMHSWSVTASRRVQILSRCAYFGLCFPFLQWAWLEFPEAPAFIICIHCIWNSGSHQQQCFRIAPDFTSHCTSLYLW